MDWTTAELPSSIQKPHNNVKKINELRSMTGCNYNYNKKNIYEIDTS